MLKNLFLTVLLLQPLTASAHSPLASSFPKNGEKLDVPPSEIVMVFKSPAKLIRISLAASSEKQRKSLLGRLFGGRDGELIVLDTSSLMTIGKRHTISLPPLGRGDYLFSWRALGEDAHVIKGELNFTIAGV